MNNKEKLYLSKAAAGGDFSGDSMLPWMQESLEPHFTRGINAFPSIPSAPDDTGKLGPKALGKAVSKAVSKAPAGMPQLGQATGDAAKSIGTGGVKGFGPMKGKGVSRGGPVQQEQFAKNKAFFGPGFSRGMAAAKAPLKAGVGAAKAPLKAGVGVGAGTGLLGKALMK
jgi:hypothetical protein